MSAFIENFDQNRFIYECAKLKKLNSRSFTVFFVRSRRTDVLYKNSIVMLKFEV